MIGWRQTRFEPIFFMETLNEHRKLNSLSPSWTSKSKSPVGQSSYVHLGTTSSQIHTQKPARKSKSEKLEVRSKTRKKLVQILTELGEDRKAESMAVCGERFEVLTCGEHIVAKKNLTTAATFDIVQCVQVVERAGIRTNTCLTLWIS